MCILWGSWERLPPRGGLSAALPRLVWFAGPAGLAVGPGGNFDVFVVLRRGGETDTDCGDDLSCLLLSIPKSHPSWRATKSRQEAKRLVSEL